MFIEFVNVVSCGPRLNWDIYFKIVTVIFELFTIKEDVYMYDIYDFIYCNVLKTIYFNVPL